MSLLEQMFADGQLVYDIQCRVNLTLLQMFLKQDVYNVNCLYETGRLQLLHVEVSRLAFE